MTSKKRAGCRVRMSIVFAAMGVLLACGEREDGSAGALVDSGQGVRTRTPLPNWATPEELEIQRRAPIADLQGRLRGSPPASPFHVPAEYEPTMAVVMTWAGYTAMLAKIGAAVASSGAQVWVVGGPSSIAGVPADRYEALGYAYDTVWTRDYGPFGIDQTSGKLGIIDPTYRHYASRVDDDAIPCRIAAHAGASCYTTSLILDGGNFLTDGQGNLFMTSRTYAWNSNLSRDQVDKLLKDYFGVKTIHVLDYAQSSPGSPADGTGHIDMFVKLLSSCKVLIAEATSAPFLKTLEQAATYFSGLTCPEGKPYEIHRIKGYASGGTWYTYTNSLIVNKTVIMPSYASGDNEAAKKIYEQALPGYTVVPVASDSSITAGGSIHCVTKEIPEVNPTDVPPPPPPPPPAENQPPVVHAGAAQQVDEGSSVTLDGTKSADPEGAPLSYAWTQTAGPAVKLSDPKVARPTFTAPAVEADTTLSFALVVSDGLLDSAAALVDVLVKNAATPQVPGVIEAKMAGSPLSIPDSNTTGIKSSIAVSPNARVGSLAVTVNITHPYTGAVRIRLTCPSGTQLTLQSYAGSSANIHKTFAVSGCNGQTTQGSWILTVDDRDGYSDKGTLDDWSLKITPAP